VSEISNYYKWLWLCKLHNVYS